MQPRSLGSLLEMLKFMLCKSLGRSIVLVMIFDSVSRATSSSGQ